MFNELLVFLMHIIDLIGVAILCYGVGIALLRGVGVFLKIKAPVSIDQIRLKLGQSIVLAVEFLLVSDIIKTIISPNYYEIGMLGALVIIRTVLTYFLNQELMQLGHI